MDEYFTRKARPQAMRMEPNMYIAYLAHIGGKVVIPDAIGIRNRDDHSLVDFIDATGRVLVTFRRQDVAMHGPEEELPADPFGAK